MLGDVFYWDHWYDSENSTAPAEDDDKKILYENKVLGVARLRQVHAINPRNSIKSKSKIYS